MKDYILNWNQKRILKKVGFLKKYGFYLAGGTALALQLGHRTSRDLDFFTPHHFKGLALTREFQKIFNKEIQKPGLAEDTLWLKFGDTDISFFRYPYKLIRPFLSYLTVKLASPEDIAAMKIEAIIERGTKRDFVDIYYLMKKYGLKQLLNLTQEKYPEAFNEQVCLIALMYFKDAEITQKDRKRLYLYKDIEWKKIKEYIEKEVKQYQLETIKKR
jgi:predicted nucleotidyltransferase component of viral defense system